MKSLHCGDYRIVEVKYLTTKCAKDGSCYVTVPDTVLVNKYQSSLPSQNKPVLHLFQGNKSRTEEMRFRISHSQTVYGTLLPLAFLKIACRQFKSRELKHIISLFYCTVQSFLELNYLG